MKKEMMLLSAVLFMGLTGCASMQTAISDIATVTKAIENTYEEDLKESGL